MSGHDCPTPRDPFSPFSKRKEWVAHLYQLGQKLLSLTLKQWLLLSPVLALALGLLILLPDLFMILPWHIRKGMGWSIMAALCLLGLRRLLTVQPADQWLVQEATSPVGRPEKHQDALTILLLHGSILSLILPILAPPGDQLGFGDWDYFLEKYEAARITIAEHEEFPWWNPWCRGGVPLASAPLVGILAPPMPLVLGFGTSIGLRLATIVYLMIGAEGARRLGLLCFHDPWAALATAWIFTLNGGVLVDCLGGFHIPVGNLPLPWLLLSVAKLHDRRWAGVSLGFWLAWAVLNPIHYATIYLGPIIGLAWIRGLAVHHQKCLGKYLLRSIQGLGLFLALAGWRIATVAAVMSDFPRALSSTYSETLWTIWVHLTERTEPRLIQFGALHSYFWETCTYVGPLVLILAITSLLIRIQWWHWLLLVCGWLAAGSIEWFHASYWLDQFPVFSSLHVVTRWRFPALLGLALAVGQTVNWAGRSSRWDLRWATRAVVVAIGVDFVSYGWSLFPIAFSVAPLEDNFPGPPTDRLIAVSNNAGFPAVLRGYGVVHCQEPQLGYNRFAITNRRWREHPDYQGEFWTQRGELVPREWHPNHILLIAQPHESVWVNQNPGSYWRVNGQQAFPGTRWAEMRRDFVVKANEQGRVELTLRPAGLDRGIVLHGMGFVILGLGLVGSRWINMRFLQPQDAPPPQSAAPQSTAPSPHSPPPAAASAPPPEQSPM